MLNTYVAVSYTHLDVYKRQVPKPTPTQRVQAEKVSTVDSDLLPVDCSPV